MTKFKVETGNAEAQLNALIKTFNSVKQSVEKMGTTGKVSIKTMESALSGLNSLGSQFATVFKQMDTQYSNLSKSQRNFVTQTNNLKKTNADLREEITLLLAVLDLERQKYEASIKALQTKKVKLTELQKIERAEAVALEKLNAVNSQSYSNLVKINQAISQRTAELKKEGQAIKTKIPPLTEEEKLTKKLLVAKQQLSLASSQEYADLIRTKKALADKNKELMKSEDSTKKASGGFSGLIGSVKGLFAAFGLIAGFQLFASIIKDAFELIKTFDSLRFALEKITKTAFDYGISSRFLIEITNDFGVELESTTERWIKFLAAAKQSGLTLKATEDIFRSMTKAGAVLGLKTHELQGIYLALEQMLSKGKVTTEELRRQLGERLPGAMGIMASSMGITIVELDKMLKKGQVLSAEVLPDFAKAVELAYGIETQETVNTLVSAQERLSNSWSNFVRFVVTDTEFLKDSFNTLAKIMNGAAMYFSENFRDEMSIIDVNKGMEEDLLDGARETVDKRLGIDKFYATQKEKLQAKDAEILRAKMIQNNEAQIKILEQHYADLLTQLSEYNTKVDEEMRNYSYNNLEDAKVDYEGDQKALEENLAKQAKIVEKYQSSILGVSTYTSPFMLLLSKNATKGLREQEEALRGNLILSTAYYEMVKKLTEPKTDPLKIDDPNDNGSKIRLKELGDLEDYEKDIRIGRLESVVDFNNSQIEADETYYEEKIRLAKENQMHLDEIAEMQMEKEIDRAVWRIDEEKAKNAKLLKEGRVTQKDYDEWLFDAEKNRGQLVLMAQQKAQDKIFQNELDFTEKEMKLKKDGWQREIDVIKRNYNLLIYEENKRWDSQTPAYKRDEINRKEHDEAIKKLNHEADQEQKKALIAFLEKEMIKQEALGKNVDGIKNWIAELKKGIVDYDPAVSVDERSKREIEALQDLLDKVNEFAQSVGDVFDALSERKIANIEAEMRAEERKYEALIALEGDNATARLALEKERDDRLAIMEKKKIKEEAKQARIRKAFAVADIATKLAQTIMAIKLAAMEQNAIAPYAFGSIGALYQALQIPLAIGIAVAQTAAVLAQPVPQYKDGGIINKPHQGMINDGLSQEYIERDNKILTTKTKNAIVNLKSGDIVHKDFESLQRNSMIMSAMLNGARINEQQFDVFFDRIEDSIEKGFTKAKINNNIKVLNKTSNGNYRESLSRWN